MEFPLFNIVPGWRCGHCQWTPFARSCQCRVVSVALKVKVLRSTHWHNSVTVPPGFARATSQRPDTALPQELLIRPLVLKMAMKFSVADVVRAYTIAMTCRVSNGPVLLPEGFWCVTYRLSGTLDRLRKLDMVQHCNWIACGNDGLGGKG